MTQRDQGGELPTQVWLNPAVAEQLDGLVNAMRNQAAKEDARRKADAEWDKATRELGEARDSVAAAQIALKGAIEGSMLR